MLRNILKMFILLLYNITVNASDRTKCVSISNQKCKMQPTLINFYPNKCNHELHYYPFAVKLDRCVGSFKNLNDLVPNKEEDLNLGVLNMIKGINKSKMLTKHIPCECKCRFDGRICNSDQSWNNNKCRYGCKKRHVCEKDYFWNTATCNCENGKYLASIMDDSAIICD